MMVCYIGRVPTTSNGRQRYFQHAEIQMQTNFGRKNYQRTPLFAFAWTKIQSFRPEQKKEDTPEAE